MRFTFLLLVAAPIAALAGGATPERKFPEITFEEAHPVLIVASVSPGGSLGEFEECKKPNVICLHSPEWFRAKTLMTVYGEEMPARLEIYSASHYGQERYENAGPVLINLFVKDGVAFMPINQYMSLVKGDDGEWFLPVEFPETSTFLPCSVKEIWEEFGPVRLHPPLEKIKREEYRWRNVEEHPELYVVSGDRAVVRYGVRMTRLKDYLIGTQLSRTSDRCLAPVDAAEGVTGSD